MNKKHVTILTILLLFFLSVLSQNSTELYTNAKLLYENGNYFQAIQNLKRLEQSIAPNPKVQSLLVYAYVGNNDFINAKIELEKFKKVVGMKRSPAIQAVLDLEKQINDAVSAAQNSYKQKVDKKRLDEAIKIKTQQDNQNRIKRQTIEQQFQNRKGQITANAKPEEIMASVANTTGTQKVELLKNLRKEKKVKKAWKVQFADKKLDRIVKLEYFEYNLNGALIRYLSKEFGESYNTAFGDFPDFEVDMVTATYIEKLIRSNDFNTFTQYTISTPINSSNNLLLTQKKRTTFQKYNTGITQTNDLVFTWEDRNGDLVKDSTINNYSTYVRTYGKNSKTVTYKNNRRTSETLVESIQNGIKETQNYTYISYENNRKTSTSDFTNYEYNEMGDVYTYKNKSGHYENNIYKYDNYGNILYNDKYNVDYDYTYSYFYNFYEYQDGYTTNINEYKYQKANNTIPQKPTAAELYTNYEKGVKNYYKGFTREAKRLMDICSTADSNNIAYLYWLAAIYEKANVNVKSLGYLDKLLSIDPTFTLAYELKGKISNKTNNREQAIRNYKLAADWGSSYASKVLQNYYSIKYKTDDALLDKEYNPNIIAPQQGVYQYQGSDPKLYARLQVGNKSIYFQNLKSEDPKSYTSEMAEYQQSKKNPNLYLWKPNSKYRIIIRDNGFYYLYPDGFIVYDLPIK